MRVALFTGSSLGQSPAYARGAGELARHLAHVGVDIVYGGGHVGLMGVVADAAMEAGGHVHGVIPEHLQAAEDAHGRISVTEVVPDMHTRKARMADLADAFVALPGGLGTLEELFEVWTWRQLGLHHKPVALYDIDGFWSQLQEALRDMSEAGFIAPDRLAELVHARGPEDLLAQLRPRVGTSPR